MTLLEKIGVVHPIVQAPMAGTSTPELAAAASNAGALGSLGVAAVDAAGARAMIAAVRARSQGPLNVNLFVHAPAVQDPQREADWLAAMAPLFERFGAEPPQALRPIYTSFLEDEAMLAMLLEEKPEVVSFHFGLPQAEKIAALKSAGCLLLSTATSLAEAAAAQAAGIDAVVAQGWEAGGHRGVFDPAAADDRLGTMALTRLLVQRAGLPVIAAGGIMDGRGVAAVLALGASAAQMGTAFLLSDQTAVSGPWPGAPPARPRARSCPARPPWRRRPAAAGSGGSAPDRPGPRFRRAASRA
jgi:nitronate monooxygenase